MYLCVSTKNTHNNLIMGRTSKIISKSRSKSKFRYLSMARYRPWTWSRSKTYYINREWSVSVSRTLHKYRGKTHIYIHSKETTRKQIIKRIKRKLCLL